MRRPRRLAADSAFQVIDHDDSERPRYAKTVVARGAIYAQKSEPDWETSHPRGVRRPTTQLNFFLTSSMPCVSRFSATLPLAAAARIFSAAATAASAAAARTSASACASALVIFGSGIFVRGGA